MTTFTESKVRQAGKAAAARLRKDAGRLLAEAAKALPGVFDIFLSHSIRDAEIVLGVKAILEEHGKTVYVDWLEDPQLDRSNVTKETAQKIRSRLRQCRSLVYLHTYNSPNSKWMPWELGYFDGFKGTVAIFPVTLAVQESFVGQEYLSIYPYIDECMSTNKKVNLYSNFTTNEYAELGDWIDDPKSLRKRA